MYILYQIATYFWNIFGITVLSLLHIKCVTIQIPQKYLVWQFTHFSLATSYFSFRLYLYIFQYVSGNVYPSSLLTQQISSKVTLVIYLSTIPELINGCMLKASVMSLSGTFIYLILGLYSSNNKRQHSTIFVVKFQNMILLWSVYTVIKCTNRMLNNSFRVYTILNISRYLVV